MDLIRIQKCIQNGYFSLFIIEIKLKNKKNFLALQLILFLGRKFE
jgi:hypothetical protein